MRNDRGAPSVVKAGREIWRRQRSKALPRSRFWVGVCLALTALPSGDVLAAHEIPKAVQEMEAAAGGPVRATLSRTTDHIAFLSLSRNSPLVIPAGPGLSAENRARAFLDTWGPAFGISNANDLALLRASSPDEVGMEHVRFQQTHRGVPVTGGEITVHLRGADVTAVNVKILPDLESVATVPIISAAESEVWAWQFLADHLLQDGVALSQPRLELLNRGLLEGRLTETRLAWFIEARRIDLREFIWIDAHTGKLLLQFSQLTDIKDRDVHDADDPEDGELGVLPGLLVRSEGEPAVGDADADAAYDYSGDTYDYFFAEHGRDSYDDAGSVLTSTVHFCPNDANCPFANAFWNGRQLVYGGGYPQADDVDAHELVHAVTEFTAGLFYYMQSGALSESFSDIFGETVDLTNSAGTDTLSVRWKMGEDVPYAGAARDLMDPTIFGHPGKMSDAEFACFDDYRDDKGGVHVNSGVPNHAYALMVDGGSYNGKTVTGIGLAKAGKIQYRSLAYYLTSASSFLDNDNALLQSCQDLVGASGITADDCAEVESALDAVEMSDPWPCRPATAAVPDDCPPGQVPDVWHHEDIENGFETLPACPSSGTIMSWCVEEPSSLLGAFATSGVRSLWGYSRSSAGEISVESALGKPLPPNMRMQFNHAHGFENSGTSFFDGGLVEYSTDGGTTWWDGGSLITAGQTYGGTIISASGNPCGGQSAFVGDSWGYTASQLDLAAATGGSEFAYRFKVCTDLSYDEYGWFVDDILIYECVDCLADVDCDNGIFCDGAETCDAANTCQAGTPPVVDDGVDCTDDSCDEGDDTIVNSPNDSLCDNGLFCDGVETCDATNDCEAGTPPAVDDGIGCTDDSCNEVNDTLVNSPNEGLCNNGLFCDGVETCDAVFDCQVESVRPCAADQFCDEAGNVCLDCPSTWYLDANDTGAATLYRASVAIIAASGFTAAGPLAVALEAPLIEFENGVVLGAASATNKACQ